MLLAATQLPKPGPGNCQTLTRSAHVMPQGCMNNLTFGDEGMGYYETIAGGAGAGPHWHGRSGVHTHMTNTCVYCSTVLTLPLRIDVLAPDRLQG